MTVYAQDGDPGASGGGYGDRDSGGPVRSRSRRHRRRWLRRLTRAVAYLLASGIALMGLFIGLVGVSAGQRSGDPGDAWAGLIIGAIFVLTAILWFVWLMGKKRRRH